MKRLNNRQNKLPQIKPPIRSIPLAKPIAFDQPLQENGFELTNQRCVVGLVSNLFVATKIAQSAKKFGFNVHNFDKSDPLIQLILKKKPVVVILDFDQCEAEAFKVLNSKRHHADLMGVPVVGYLSDSKRIMKEEAQRAGCDRVYGKTEFGRVLDDLMMRYG